MRIRPIFITSFFIFLYFALIFNTYNLQIKNGAYYSARAASQYRLSGFLEPQRGNIYFTDRNGNNIPAAMNKNYPVIFAVPKEIKDPLAAAESLYNILGLDKEKLAAQLSKPNSLYELLARKASDDQVKAVRDLGLSGIYFDEETGRFYPFQTLAASLLGFVGQNSEDSNLSGRYGLELYYENSLNGEAGHLDGDKIINPVSGKDIYLTIDSNIQTRAEELLSSLVQQYKAERGMVMVQEPKTGKILAMGTYPSFDPNDYSQYGVETFLNQNFQAVYEPGSVMKVITMATGLDTKKLTPETTFVDPGYLTLNGYTVRNWDLKAHGKVTMTGVIEQSINTGAAYAERLIGKDLFYNYLVKFGFGQKTGIELPGELSGSLGNLRSSSRDINFATAAFGQGVSVTPLQMINAFSAVANGGVLNKPYIIKEESPTEIRRVVSPEAARQATEMMVSAVRKAVIAQIPKFDIAGKTGTAQIPDFKHGGYADEYIHTYIGFAPAFNPQFTVLIRIDKPQGAPLAGLTVVPAFRELSQFILNYYNVPPDHNE